MSIILCHPKIERRFFNNLGIKTYCLGSPIKLMYTFRAPFQQPFGWHLQKMMGGRQLHLLL